MFAGTRGHAQGNDAVKITVKPQRPIIEITESDLRLSFDFSLVNNSGRDVLKLDSVQVSVFDSTGNFEQRRMVDSHGVNPSIQTIGASDLNSNEETILFNPFYSFQKTLSLDRLDYEFVFVAPSTNEIYKQAFTVQPIAYNSRTDLRVPLRGRVIAEFGHDYYSPHRRIDLANPIVRQVGLTANRARYADDLSIVDKAGRLFKEDPDQLSDWYAFRSPVYAPGSGRVVTLVDEVPDNTIKNGKVVFSDAVTYEKPSGIFGNYIVIDHGNGEFSLFAHLEHGSFKVKLGQTVKQGVQLAEIGFSGDADFIHTHYQLQAGPDPKTAEGLPAYFSGITRAVGSKLIHIARGAIDSGEIVLQ